MYNRDQSDLVAMAAAEMPSSDVIIETSSEVGRWEGTVGVKSPDIARNVSIL